LLNLRDYPLANRHQGGITSQLLWAPERFRFKSALS
jgi:hypothetical protein